MQRDGGLRLIIYQQPYGEDVQRRSIEINLTESRPGIFRVLKVRKAWPLGRIKTPGWGRSELFHSSIDERIVK